MRAVHALAAVTLLASSSALAEPARPSSPTVLPNLLPSAEGGTVDLRADYVHAGDVDGSLDAATLAAHAQYLTPRGLGGYLALPVGASHESGSTRTGVGNLEGGVLVAIRKHGADVLLRGGLALDNATSEGEFLLPALTFPARLLDGYASGFATTWARGDVQVRGRLGVLQLGARAGFDRPLSGVASDLGFDGIVKLGASVGVAQPGFGVAVGFALIDAIAGSDREISSSVSATVDVPVAPQVRAYAAFELPLDPLGDSTLFSLGAGVRIGLQ